MYTYIVTFRYYVGMGVGSSRLDYGGGIRDLSLSKLGRLSKVLM